MTFHPLGCASQVSLTLRKPFLCEELKTEHSNNDTWVIGITRAKPKEHLYILINMLDDGEQCCRRYIHLIDVPNRFLGAHQRAPSAQQL